MRAAVHINSAPHQKRYAEAMVAGLNKHGIKVSRAPFNTPHAQSDFAVIWGWRQPAIVEAGKPVLVMERGHVAAPPKMKGACYDASDLPWLSLGWNGICGRGTYPECQDDGERWETHFGSLMKPWRCGAAGYALVAGQISGDASIRHVDFREWARDAAICLAADGYRVLYRPHPISVARNDFWHPPHSAPTPKGASLQEDLDGAAVVVTYNSGMGVDAVLSGVPTVAFDAGSMAWPVTTHSMSEHVAMPDREPWAERLAWAQWTIDEIASGAAWDVVKHA